MDEDFHAALQISSGAEVRISLLQSLTPHRDGLSKARQKERGPPGPSLFPGSHPQTQQHVQMGLSALGQDGRPKSPNESTTTKPHLLPSHSLWVIDNLHSLKGSLGGPTSLSLREGHPPPIFAWPTKSTSLSLS